MQTGFTRFPTPFFISRTHPARTDLLTREGTYSKRERSSVPSDSRYRGAIGPRCSSRLGSEASAIDVAPPRKRDAGWPGQCSNFTGMGVFG